MNEISIKFTMYHAACVLGGYTGKFYQLSVLRPRISIPHILGKGTVYHGMDRIYSGLLGRNHHMKQGSFTG